MKQAGEVDITLKEEYPKAVGFILRIAPHKGIDIDRDLSLEEIANVAIVADKYCMALFNSHNKDWTPKLVAREIDWEI